MGAASAGGKTAVNLPEGRNLVGMFWQSSAVDDVGAGTADAAPA
nr:hypothetical protein [Micromonospora sp. RTGN7]